MKMILLTEDDFRAIISDELKGISFASPKSQEDEQPVTQQEICTYLNITEPTVIRWKKKGLIPFLQIGSRVLFQKSKVIAALDGKKKGTSRGK